MTVNLFVADLVIWFACYRGLLAVVEAIQMSIDEANRLEHLYGTDIGAAARSYLGGKRG